MTADPETLREVAEAVESASAECWGREQRALWHLRDELRRKAFVLEQSALDAAPGVSGVHEGGLQGDCPPNAEAAKALAEIAGARKP